MIIKGFHCFNLELRKSQKPVRDKKPCEVEDFTKMKELFFSWLPCRAEETGPYQHVEWSVLVLRRSSGDVTKERQSLRKPFSLQPNYSISSKKKKKKKGAVKFNLVRKRGWLTLRPLGVKKVRSCYRRKQQQQNPCFLLVCPQKHNLNMS